MVAVLRPTLSQPTFSQRPGPRLGELGNPPYTNPPFSFVTALHRLWLDVAVNPLWIGLVNVTIYHLSR